MTKSIQNPYIKFIGHNSEAVTGSCNLIRHLSYTILLDCGGVQTNDEDKDYVSNSKFHKDIKPKNIDGVILTHQNIDHLMKIPLLYQNGANCPFYIPKGMKGILTIMFQDCVKIFNQDYERHKRKPIYSQEDVDKTLSYIIECDLHDKIKINNNIFFTYYRAEHIPKARQVVLELFDGVNTKKIGFTGDISNKSYQYYIDDFEPLNEHLDVLVGECTYSGNKRINKPKDREKDKEKLKMAIDYAIQNKSKILIPTFANCRLQEILTTIYDMYNGEPPIKIIIHTPLGESICHEWENIIDKNKDLWNDIKSWEGKLFLQDIRDVDYFGKQKKFPLLILSSGGFLKQGTSMAWIKYILPDPKSYIIFCGYATPESNAGKIKSGELKEMKVDHRIIRNKCKALILNSFSSHMDREQLLGYYTQLQYTKLCLVHSEMDSKITFAEELRKRLSKENRTSKVIATNFETKINI